MPVPRSIPILALSLVLSSFQPNYDLLAQKEPGQSRPPAPAKAIEPKEKQPDYSQEAFVIEQVRMVQRYEKDGTGQRGLNIRVKVHSDAGVERFGQLIFPYSSASEKLQIDLVRVRKADGTVITASANDVQDLSAPIAREAPIYTDLRQKHVTVPGFRPGDLLEYRVVWRIDSPIAQNHFWFEHNFVTREVIVLDEQVEVNIPRDSQIKVKFEKGYEPVIKEENERRLYSWKHSNLKRDTEEEQARRRKEEFEDPRAPQVQMTTFQSWDEVGRWYASLERDRIVPDEKVRAKVDELVRDLAGDKEKIETLYRFVARNFRYVSLSLGQGRYQPHAARDVLANQYGDCKDKHTLLAAMLTAAGLSAYPVLMNSSRKVDPDIPSPAQFDHVISAIPLGNETLWADTTAEVAPFQLLSPALRDKQALLIPTNGSARLETTPAEPPFLSSEVLEMEGKVDDLGKLTALSHLTLRGDSEMLFRIMFRRTPRSDWKQLGSYLSMVSSTPGEVTELKPSEPAATEKPFELEYQVSRGDFLDWSSKKMKLSLPLPPMTLVNVDVDKPGNSKPIQLGPPIDITYRLKLSFPAKYQIRIPLPLKVSRDYAEYSSTYRMDGNTLTAERTLRLRQRQLPSERLEDYSAFVAAARSDENQTLSLETDLTGAPAIPDSVKVEELIQAAESAAKNANYLMTEELLTRAIEKDPKHKTARRQLGWALLVQRKYEAAAEVLREQTRINPFDDYSYNLLGQVFWKEQKYADAETAFRKQIEITPLDKWAHGHLGQMLVDWRKYEAAVPELEKGVSLNPEEVSLYVALGRAYLNLGKIEKGTEAFDQAVKLDAGPGVWNDVAYFLSLSKVQLAKAQQFAESAVTALTTDLRNVELATLELEHMQDVSRLAAYWDTLGWVHFQKGDMDLAQRYIIAAWVLGQHSEVGYHMGQIEEKRGRREEAIRMYSLAVAAFDPVPEARESLDRLLGKEWNQALFRKAQDELRQMRTIELGPVGKNLKNTTEGQFYVVLVPGSSRTAEVSEVKFIGGDEKLRPLEAALKTANYNFTFPDEAATKVIRRGTVFCKSSAGECSFMMISPELITAID